MVASLPRWLIPAVLCAVAGSAAAQTPPPAASKPDPLDPNAKVPTVVYESAFSRYRRTVDAQPIPWREANDNVARVGGWRAYAREAQQPDPAASAPAATPAKPATQAMPMPQGHRGHQMP